RFLERLVERGARLHLLLAGRVLLQALEVRLDARGERPVRELRQEVLARRDRLLLALVAPVGERRESLVGLARGLPPGEGVEVILGGSPLLGELGRARRLLVGGGVAPLRVLEALLRLGRLAVLDEARDLRAALSEVGLVAPGADLLEERRAVGRLLALDRLGGAALRLREVVL